MTASSDTTVGTVRMETREPLISVCIITYNHHWYIGQAIESVLSQQTDFAVEIIVGEDGSTDGTAEIVQDISERHPGRIRILRGSRQEVIAIDGRATGRQNLLRVLQHARGKYIALLEGDDFWTDLGKLQKQVDFLEAHPDYFLSGHFVRNVDESGAVLNMRVCSGDTCPESFTIKHALGGTPLHASSWVFRRFSFEAPMEQELIVKVPAGDDLLALILLKRGRGHCFQQYSSSYRLHAGGVWFTKTQIHKYFDLLQFRYIALGLLQARHSPSICLRIAVASWKILDCALAQSLLTRSLKPIGSVISLARKQRLIPGHWLGVIFASGVLGFPAYLGFKLVQRSVRS